MIFSVFQKNRVFGYSGSTLLWHWCYYPHRSRDALSPVCGIFAIAFAVGWRPWPCGHPVATSLTDLSSCWSDKNRHVWKTCNWSRVVDCLKTVSWLFHDCLMTVSWLSNDCIMTVSWLSHDCLMLHWELFRILWAMGQCRVGPGFFKSD